VTPADDAAPCGAYVRRPGAAALRLSRVIASETAVSAAYVAYTFRSSVGGGVGLRRRSGGGPVIVLTAEEADVPRSLIATTDRVGWVLPAGDPGGTVDRYLGTGGIFAIGPALQF
jgi:hypothetical protein